MCVDGTGVVNSRQAALGDGTFSRDDVTFERQADVYICPKRKTLRTTGRVHAGRTRLYRASKADCDPCPLKH